MELCEGPGGRPGPPVPNGPYGLWGRKATLNLNSSIHKAQELCESGGGRPGLPVPNSPYGVCGVYGRKATLNLNLCHKEFRSCIKVEVTVLGFQSLISLMVSVDVKS